MASSSVTSRSRSLVVGALIAAATVLAGCATAPEDKATARSPASLTAAMQAPAPGQPVDPWASATPPEPRRWRLFKWLSWRSLMGDLAEDEEELARANPYRPGAQFEVMRLRNPSDVAVIKTVPETVLWTGSNKYAFTKQQVQWQKPPPPPPKPPAPPPPPPPPEPVLLKVPQTVSQTIYFAFDRSALTREAKETLDILPTDNVVQVMVDAYTDAVGSDAYNDKLSARRGKAVADYLTKRGIEATVIKVEAKGKSNPVADNKTDAGRAKNRRAEVVVTVQIRG